MDALHLEEINKHFRIHDRKNFKKIIDSLNSKGKSSARANISVTKGGLKKKWEGYHVNDYGNFLVSGGEAKISEDSEQYGINKSKLDRILKSVGFKNGFEYLVSLTGNSVGDKKAISLFSAFAEYKKYEIFPFIQIYLDFLKFCHADNGGILSAFYDGSHADNKDKKSASEKKAQDNLKEIIDDLEPYVQSLINPPNRLALSTSEETWLSPANLTKIPYVGREAEIEQLNQFVGHQDKFKIWAIEGPSGSGKTRLTMEWLNRYQHTILSDWNIIILHKHDRHDPKKWQTWNPECSTLVVIDYIFGFEKVIENILVRCCDELAVKVRLLVLDHIFAAPLPSDNRWSFSGDGESLDRNEKLFFENDAMALSATIDQEIIIRQIVAQRSLSDSKSKTVEEGMNYLRNTKGAWQPLFAALVGEAIKQSTDYTKWPRRDLIRYYLKGEKRLPWENKIQLIEGRWAAHFICAAIVRRSIPYRDLQVAAAECRTRPDDFNKVTEICSKIVTSADPITLQPLEPDIFGESFFLTFLGYLEKNIIFYDEFKIALRCGNSNSKLDDLAEIISFIRRLGHNLRGEDQKSKETQDLWCRIFRFFDSSLFPKGDLISWAVSAAAVELALCAKGTLPNEQVLRLLQQVDLSDFYGQLDGYLEKVSAHIIMKHFDLFAKLNIEKNPEIPSESLLFIKNYIFKSYDRRVHLVLTASMEGLSLSLRELINAGININAIDTWGRNALWMAVMHRHYETTSLLVSHLNVNFPDNAGLTPIILACANNQPEIVDLLIENKANLDQGDNARRTPLMWACKKGHIGVVEILLREKLNLNGRDKNLRTALIVACMDGNTLIAESLINSGADINIADDNGMTALGWACMNGNKSVVELLIKDKNTDLNKINILEQTALMHASFHGHSAIVDILLKCKGLDINHSAKDKITALMWACMQGHTSIVKSLLAWGARTDLSDIDGKTAQQWACEEGHESVAEMLRKF